MTEMQQAAGSAEAEMSIIEESLDFKINALKETWVGLFQDLIDRGDIGELIDLATKLSEAIGTITDKLGLLGTAAAGLGIFELFKHGKDIGKPKSRVSNKWADNISVLMDTSVFLYAA